MYSSPLQLVGDLTKIECNWARKKLAVKAYLEKLVEFLEFPNLASLSFVFCLLQFTLKPSITDDFSIRVGIKLYNHVVCTVCFDNGLIY